MRTIALAACVLALLGTAQAQDIQSPLAITGLGTLDAPLPYGGLGNVSVTVGAGCAAILQAVAGASDQAATVTVGANATPEWLTVTPAVLTFDASACATATPTGYLTETGSVGLAVTEDAPGVVMQDLVLSATMEGSAPASQAMQFNVSYHANYTVTPSIQFPHTFNGTQLNFTVTVTVQANARSMVMFDPPPRPTAGSFSGLASDFFEPPQTKVYTVTYKPPQDAENPWTEATINVRSFVHFNINGTNQAGGAEQVRDMAWVVRNGGGPSGGDGNAAPMGAAPLLLALVGAALLAARRLR